MSFSLLYKVPEEKTRCDSIKDLSIDRVVSTICSDVYIQEAALEVLSYPLNNIENILFRQEILMDFLNNDGLLDKFMRLYTDYDNIKVEWEKARHNIYVLKSHAGRNTEVYMEILILNSEYLKRVVTFPEQLYDLLNNSVIRSEALLSIKDYCEKLLSKGSYKDLLEITNSLSKIDPVNYSLQIVSKFDTMLRVSSSHLSKIYSSEKNPPKKSLLSRLFKGDGEEFFDVETNGNTINEIDNLLRMAIMEISDVVDKMVKHFYEDLYGLAKQLLFYKFAVVYNSLMESLSIPICFPTVLEDKEDVLECNDLYDLFLIVKNQYFANKIVPNDVLLTENTYGVLIRGNNNSGKTVYLRSIGIAQVFAQSGLMVCAREMKTSIRHGIYTQFASAEEFEKDIYGRFESEVKEIANIVYNLKPYSLILLNETFQTTAYDEGAVGIYDILTSISGLSVKWIFVTHILKLFDMFKGTDMEGKEIKFLKTSTHNINRYKVIDYIMDEKN